MHMVAAKRETNPIFPFLRGFSSVFDITGQTFTDDISDASSGFERDADALRGDWEHIENDLRRAMGQVVHG